MTQEEKQLLLKDLGGRLSCGVIIQVYFEDISADGYFDEELWSLELDGESVHVNDRWIENVKPYLRSMSSMTEEEKKEEFEMWAWKCSNWEMVDFYNRHHLDYRELIPMGLALEAKEGMYPTH